MTEPTTMRRTEHGLVEGEPPARPLRDWLLAQLPAAAAILPKGDAAAETLPAPEAPADVVPTDYWMLVHTTEGVIWGVVQGGQLLLSSDVGAFPAPGLGLSWETLLQLRLFGADSELLLWRGAALDDSGAPVGERWQWRRYTDGVASAGETVAFLTERYLLWGNRTLAARAPFTQVVEGQQGIVHAPPIRRSPRERQRTSLEVRHYLERNPTSGVISVGDSRLVRILEPAP